MSVCIDLVRRCLNSGDSPQFTVAHCSMSPLRVNALSVFKNTVSFHTWFGPKEDSTCRRIASILDRRLKSLSSSMALIIAARYSIFAADGVKKGSFCK